MIFLMFECLAFAQQARRSNQCHENAFAAKMSGTQPDRERLAVKRNKWLSNCGFKSCGDIVHHCCYAWRAFETAGS
jgi:hypothetical protein